MRGFRLPIFVCCLHWFLAISAQAAMAPDLEASIKRYIQKSPSVNGLRVEVQLMEPNQVIPLCIGGTVEIITPPGVRLWGRSTLQLRCARASWMVNVPMNIRAFGDYVVASRYLPFGQKLESGDFRVIEGDLTILPDDVLRTPRAAFDKVLGRPLQMGAPIGLNDLKESAVVKSGDPVLIQLVGRGFQVSGEGTAQSSGMVGDMVRVRLMDGQILQGRVIKPGVVGVNIE